MNLDKCFQDHFHAITPRGLGDFALPFPHSCCAQQNSPNNTQLWHSYKTLTYFAGFEDVKHELQPLADQLFIVILLFDGNKLPQQGLHHGVAGLGEGCAQGLDPHVELPGHSCSHRRKGEWKMISWSEEIILLPLLTLGSTEVALPTSQQQIFILVLKVTELGHWQIKWQRTGTRIINWKFLLIFKDQRLPVSFWASWLVRTTK